MLNLPNSTKLNRLLPKDKLVKKLNFSPALKNSLKDDIKKITVTNELSPKTMNILHGKSVWGVFVVEVQLKQQEIDYKSIMALGKQIGQKILFVLRYENSGQLALYYNKLYRLEWMNYDALILDISGADFNEVWDGIVSQVALEKQSAVSNDEFVVKNEREGVAQQLERQERRKKLEREIASLEKKVRSEKQPRRKLELAKNLGLLKKEL